MLLFAVLLICGAVGHSTAMYPLNGDVVELTASNFNRLVVDSDEVWIVEFYAPWCGHCQSLVPEYKKLAKAVKGAIKVGAINCDDHQSLSSQFGVQGFPTIKIFGSNKKNPVAYNGQRTAQEIADAGLRELKAKINKNLGGGGSSGSGDSGDQKSTDDVIELTDANFDKTVLDSEDVWLIEFFAPWCGHCKNLAPEWAKAAGQLKGKVKLGALDATIHTIKAQEYGIQGYPTIKFFPAGRKSRSDVRDYDGGRSANDIVTWALDKHADSVPPPEIKQLIDESVARDACETKPLCVVAILPHILDCDAKCRNKHLTMLTELGAKYKQKQWGWLWSEGAAQPKVEEVLELGGFGYPAMAAVNLKKMKYTTLRGAFSKEGIDEFLRDISYGRGQTAPVKGAKIPKISKLEPWDGKDGQLPVEDDIDLTDVVLDEKDEL